MIVSLNFIELVKEFAKIILESEKYVIAVNGDYRVDAGSIMGLFSLDLTKLITFEVPKGCEELKEKLLKFVIKK